MEKIGELLMEFKKVENEILYYDVKVLINKKETKIVLPRYHPFLGWIEIFGFPPQHEWCVLKRLKPFKKEAKLKINGKTFKEKLIFNSDFKNRMHSIITLRKNDEEFEYFHWFEDFSKAPKKIKGIGIFAHNNGIYRYWYLKKGIEPNKENKKISKFLKENKLPSTVMKEVTKIFEYKGNPSSIWIQKYKAKGALPPIYYKMFPLRELNLKDCKGKTIQLGYLNKEGYEIDKVHGEWYKFIILNHKTFFIKEGSWSSKEIKVNDKKERIKNTYKKELFVIN